MTEHELTEELTEAERKRWESYNQRMKEYFRVKRIEEEILLRLEEENREPTSAESVELSKLRLLYRPLILDIWENTDFHKLERRHNWQNELVEYRWRAEFSAFAELTGNLGPVLKNWLGEFNLPTMIELYERAKANCNTIQAKRSLARRKLDYASKSLIQLDQDDSELSRRIDPSKELGETRRAILGEILGELFTLFIIHIEQDLVEPLVSSARNEQQSPAPALPTFSEQSIPHSSAVRTELPTDGDGILIEFAFENLTLTDCEILCKAVGLDKREQSYKPARAWGLAEVLVYYNFVAKGRTSELVQALGKAHGIKMQPDYVPDKLTQARKGARIKTNEQLLLIGRITKNDFDELHKKQEKPQITRNTRS